jgi:hypothetical protein
VLLSESHDHRNDSFCCHMAVRLTVNEANTLKGSSVSTYPFAASLNSCDVTMFA